jgi:hypothetical protein
VEERKNMTAARVRCHLSRPERSGARAAELFFRIVVCLNALVIIRKIH